MNDDVADAHDENLDDAEGDRASPRGRRLVQVLLALNLFLVAVALMLPAYAHLRLKSLAADQSAIIAASDHLNVLREDFASFYTDRAPRREVDTIFHQIEDGFDHEEIYNGAFRAEDASMVEDWSTFIRGYAYDCPPVGQNRLTLARTFILARQVTIRVKARNIPSNADRAERIDAMPIDQLLAFGCAVHQMRRVLEHPSWVPPIGGDPWRSSAHHAMMELSAIQQQRPDLFQPLQTIADRATVPFDLSTATDLTALDTDFREQATARRRDRDSARFSVPFVAISLDVRTLEYGALVVMMLLLIETAIFHHALLLQPRRVYAARRSFYFKTLTALGKRQEPVPPIAAHALEHLVQILSGPARLVVLVLLWCGSWAPFVGHVILSDNSPASLADALALSALAAVNTALVLWNLRQLTALEAASRPAAQMRASKETSS